MLSVTTILLIHTGLSWAISNCKINNQCNQCKLISVGKKCQKNEQYEHLFCDTTSNHINIHENSYLYCDTKKNELIEKHCAPGEHFMNKTCLKIHQRQKRDSLTESGHVGDYCSNNSDCLEGMFCSVDHCICQSNFVAIHGYCYLKKNIGENGCQYSEQCYAAWPGARCVENKCECPSDINGIPYVQGHTRDGIVCILLFGEENDPVPKCPLPEYDDDLLSMPVSQIRNPAMENVNDYDTLSGEHINPLQFCSSKSTDYSTFVANGGGACNYATEPYQPENGVYIADIYDCIAVPLNNLKLAVKGIYNIHSLADGICCPNRAFTCIQPKHEAKSVDDRSTGVRSRWWFNSVTGTCEQFMWDPWDETEMQSPNNFKTREHCESYCKDTCQRGSPEYTTQNSLKDEMKPISDCQTINSCSSNFECKTIGWRQLCCLTVTSICSIAGGRPFDPSRRTNFDPGHSMKRMFNLNFEKSYRYYYDTVENRCVSFTYNGALGNFNNFKSLSDCELFCKKPQCKYGTPLKIKQVNRQCYYDSHCPSTYECQKDNQICCPKLQTICSLPLRLGNCKGIIERYWYNKAIHACQIFNYTGCQGNDNNFKTLADCEHTCANSIACSEGEALIKGECLELSKPGDLCVDNKQCLSGSFCKGGLCKCRNKHIAYRGKCVAKKAKITIKCSIPSQEPYREKKSRKIRYCSPTKNTCPKGYSCQYSRSADRNICCGYSASNRADKNSNNKSTNTRKPVTVVTNVCDFGLPFMVKGIPQSCTTISCPIDFECIFSKKAKNYFCCSKKSKERSISFLQYYN